MKIKLVFDDWKLKGESVYSTEKGVELSAQDFHSGTTFMGEIFLDKERAEELRRALNGGFIPSFGVYAIMTPIGYKEIKP